MITTAGAGVLAACCPGGQEPPTEPAHTAHPIATLPPPEPTQEPQVEVINVGGKPIETTFGPDINPEVAARSKFILAWLGDTFGPPTNNALVMGATTDSRGSTNVKDQTAVLILGRRDLGTDDKPVDDEPLELILAKNLAALYCGEELTAESIDPQEKDTIYRHLISKGFCTVASALYSHENYGTSLERMRSLIPDYNLLYSQLMFYFFNPYHIYTACRASKLSKPTGMFRSMYEQAAFSILAILLSDSFQLPVDFDPQAQGVPLFRELEKHVGSDEWFTDMKNGLIRLVQNGIIPPQDLTDELMKQSSEVTTEMGRALCSRLYYSEVKEPKDFVVTPISPLAAWYIRDEISAKKLTLGLAFVQEIDRGTGATMSVLFSPALRRSGEQSNTFTASGIEIAYVASNGEIKTHTVLADDSMQSVVPFQPPPDFGGVIEHVDIQQLEYEIVPASESEGRFTEQALERRLALVTPGKTLMAEEMNILIKDGMLRLVKTTNQPYETDNRMWPIWTGSITNADATSTD